MTVLQEYERQKAEFPVLPPVRNPDGTVGKAIVRIVCSQCDTASELGSSVAGAMATEWVKKRFQQRGWKLGSKRSKDLCPDCASPKPKAVTPPAPKEEPAVNAAPRLSTDDRRIVFAKLTEVYISDTKGYQQGWDDARVAADLGCPKPWVTEVRIEMFGQIETLPPEPHPLEAEVVALRAEVAEMKEALAVALKLAKTSEEQARLAARAADISARKENLAAGEEVMKLKQAMGSLAADRERIKADFALMQEQQHEIIEGIYEVVKAHRRSIRRNVFSLKPLKTA